MSDYNEAQEKQINAVTNALLKAVIIICVCVLVGITMNSCQVDSDTIADCNEACQSADSQMESVTSYKCVCAPKGQSNSPWVLN